MRKKHSFPILYQNKGTFNWEFDKFVNFLNQSFLVFTCFTNSDLAQWLLAVPERNLVKSFLLWRSCIAGTLSYTAQTLSQHRGIFGKGMIKNGWLSFNHRGFLESARQAGRQGIFLRQLNLWSQLLNTPTPSRNWLAEVQILCTKCE